MAVKGKGGHGAFPHTAVDPVATASEIVGALQTITSLPCADCLYPQLSDK